MQETTTATMPEYCLEYTHNSVRWALTFFAENDEDADRKAQSLQESLVVRGRLEARIPA